jgi:hypothetical protein
MKIGMTGSRDGITKEAQVILKNFLKSNDIEEAHHGDCIGADTKFHNEVAALNIKIIIHPPDNNAMRSFCKGNTIKPSRPYLTRNHNIVDETDTLIAFPSTKEEIVRSGTWSTIRYARKQNKKIFIVFPDGSIESTG